MTVPTALPIRAETTMAAAPHAVTRRADRPPTLRVAPTINPAVK